MSSQTDDIEDYYEFAQNLESKTSEVVTYSLRLGKEVLEYKIWKN